MKLMLTFYFHVALLPSIIYGEKTLLECSNDVTKIAKEGGLIEGIFKPTGDKTLGMGRHGFTYRGILLPIQKEIVMKFTLSNEVYTQDEYITYSYLNAINNPDVERYGIPSIYYYGTWNEINLAMLGISLFDQTIEELKHSGHLFSNDVNVLIILRDFILSSKYIHSHAVRHNDIKMKNIMVRKHRSFLIDFNHGSEMNERTKFGNRFFMSRRSHRNEERYPKDDWEMFLYSMCYTLGVQWKWFELPKFPNNTLMLEDFYKMKSNTTYILEEIGKIGSETLRNIFLQFAQHIFDDGGELVPDETHKETICNAGKRKRIPDYDRFYKLVNDEIDKSNLTKPVMFTWLTSEQREEAIIELKEHPLPDIAEITDPKDIDLFRVKYPDVHFEEFTQIYRDWNSSSSHFRTVQ